MPTHSQNLTPIKAMLLVSILFTGAIFGFFYAWVCSTMWGLDTIDPNIAIAAMNGMNASVRNPVFFPAFFLTPVVLLLTGALSWRVNAKKTAYALITASLIYLIFAFTPTVLINVPMNQALMTVQTPLPEAEALDVWGEYSPRWQVSNQVRTIASALALLVTGYGLLLFKPKSEAQAAM